MGTNAEWFICFSGVHRPPNWWWTPTIRSLAHASLDIFSDWSFWSPQVPVVSSLVGQRVPVEEELGEPTHVSVVGSLSPPL